LMEKGFSPEMAIISDGAGQFAILVTVHGVASRAGAEVAVGRRGKRSNPVAS